MSSNPAHETNWQAGRYAHAADDMSRLYGDPTLKLDAQVASSLSKVLGQAAEAIKSSSHPLHKFEGTLDSLLRQEQNMVLQRVQREQVLVGDSRRSTSRAGFKRQF